MIKLTPQQHSDHFILEADEPIVVEVSLPPGATDANDETNDTHLIAHVYRQKDLDDDREADPVGAFDGSIENFGWENDLPHGGGYYLGWINLKHNGVPLYEEALDVLQAAFDRGVAGYFQLLGFHNWFGLTRWWFAIERADCETDHHHCAHELSRVVTTAQAIEQVRNELAAGVPALAQGAEPSIGIAMRMPRDRVTTSTWYAEVQAAGYDLMPTLKPSK